MLLEQLLLVKDRLARAFVDHPGMIQNKGNSVSLCYVKKTAEKVTSGISGGLCSPCVVNMHPKTAEPPAQLGRTTERLRDIPQLSKNKFTSVHMLNYLRVRVAKRGQMGANSKYLYFPSHLSPIPPLTHIFSALDQTLEGKVKGGKNRRFLSSDFWE